MSLPKTNDVKQRGKSEETERKKRERLWDRECEKK